MIDQCAYLKEILQRFDLANAHVAPNPLPQGYHLMNHKGIINPKIRLLFQQVIGSLLYLILGSCPDIAYAVITLSKHVAKPSKEYPDHTLYICHSGIRFKHLMLANRLVHQTSRLYFQLAISPTI